MPSPIITKESHFLKQWLMLVSVLLAFGVFIAQNIYSEHVRIDAEEREQLLAQTTVVDQNMSRQLDSISRALLGIRNDLDEWATLADGDERAAQYLNALVDAMPGVRTFSVTDAQGAVTASNREQLIGHSFRQFDYFQSVLRDPRSDMLYVSKPYTTSLGVYSMSVSRAIIDADGKFAGLISATLAPAEFEVLLNSVRYAPDVWTFLAHSDGTVFMMVPGRKKVPGTNLAQPGTLFTLHSDSHQTSNVFVGMVYLTGEQRMIALRTVQPASLLMDRALVVAVSRDLPTIFAAWRHDVYVKCGLMGILILFSVMGLFLYQRRQRAYLAEYRHAAAEKEEQMRNQHALLNAIQESTFLMEKDGTVLLINEVGAQRLNVNAEAIIGKNIFEFLPEQLAQSRRQKFAQIAQCGVPGTIEDVRAGQNFLSSVYPVLDAQGEVARFAVYAADVTQQRRQQAIDDMLSTINQEILQGVSLHEMLTHICQRVAVLLQLEVVWLGRREPGGAISVLTAAGTAMDYVDQLKQNGVRWDDTPQGRGPVGCAVRTGQMQSFRVDDPAFQYWAKSAMEHHLQSTLAIPLVIHNEIYGVFTLYSSNPVLFDSPALISQLTSIGKHISIALEAATNQQQIRLLGSALEAAGNGVMITDPAGKIQWVNQAFSRLCGYSSQELLGQTPRILKSGQQSPEYYRALWAGISKGETWSSETVERARDGSLYTVSQTITPILNEGEITHFIAIHEDISAQKLTQERIEHLAHYDALTGLPNRALFYDRLRQALAVAKRNDGSLALLYMDLDGFKQVNDSMGHHVGDLLLMGVAERLTGCLRECDTVARLGGDEFTIIVSETHLHEDVAGVAQKIIEAISHPFDFEGEKLQIGISIGIARYSEEASTEDELMQHADQAMYEAKSAGKNTYRFGSVDRLNQR
ncbi:MAG: diguanylate cyclase [Proteobacteria bacterium]|nr:diguanylate cyclase [Pseudomonadota bacterium]